jgi:multiple sugar transport system substrate-binding protein
MAGNVLATETLNLSLMINNGKHRNALRTLVTQFEAEYPAIKLVLHEKTNAAYHQWMEQWEQSDADVVWWFAGFQLAQYARRGSIEPITDLWHEQRLGQSFPDLQPAVSWNHEIYALPLSYYPWGILFKKSLFARYQLAEPKTWDEFLHVCEALKSHGVTPLGLGSKEPWTAASWFSYLNLRINGLDFHRELLAGKQSFLDPRVKAVLIKWKYLIEKGYFLEDRASLRWKGVLPLMYRDQVGMYLIGSFFSAELTIPLSEFGFFRFPVLDEKVARYEEAPLDVLFINKKSAHKVAAKKLLEFMARPQSQMLFNAALGVLSPNFHTPPSPNPFIRSERGILAGIKGSSQYFDRDTAKAMANLGFVILGEFSDKPDIDKTMAELEKARQKYLP